MTTLRFRHVLLTKFDNEPHVENLYNMVRPQTGRAVMTLMGHCIKDGGTVQMETYYDGRDEYANIVLTWGTKRAKANRRRRSARRTND